MLESWHRNVGGSVLVKEDHQPEERQRHDERQSCTPIGTKHPLAKINRHELREMDDAYGCILGRCQPKI